MRRPEPRSGPSACDGATVEDRDPRLLRALQHARARTARAGRAARRGGPAIVPGTGDLSRRRVPEQARSSPPRRAGFPRRLPRIASPAASSSERVVFSEVADQLARLVCGQGLRARWSSPRCAPRPSPGAAPAAPSVPCSREAAAPRGTEPPAARRARGGRARPTGCRRRRTRAAAARAGRSEQPANCEGDLLGRVRRSPPHRARP